MSDEFHSKPQPGDWTFPEHMVEGMDPIALAILSEHEYEGMPIPFGFQLVESIGEDLGKVQVDGDAEAARNIRQKLNESAERYPDAPGFDRLRAHLADLLFEAGNTDEALDTVWDISQPHLLLHLAFGFLEEMEENQGDFDLVASKVKNRLFAQLSDRRMILTRAMRDRIISENHGEEQAEIFNDFLQREGAETDAIEGWAESQGSEYPNYDWNAVAETVRDDQYWGNLSVYDRQRAMLMGINFAEAVEGDAERDMELTNEFILYLNLMRWDHPEVQYWDIVCMQGAVGLARAGSLDSSLKLATTIQDDEYKSAVGVEYVQQGHDEQAFELVMTMQNYHLMAELLLDTPWQDDELGPHKLAEMITDEDTPLDMRIGFMEFVRDRFIDNDLLSRAAEYQEQIDKLRSGHEDSDD